MKSRSHVRLLATPWTAAHQAPPPWDFPGESTGVGCHCLLGWQHGVKRACPIPQSQRLLALSSWPAISGSSFLWSRKAHRWIQTHSSGLSEPTTKELLKILQPKSVDAESTEYLPPLSVCVSVSLSVSLHMHMCVETDREREKEETNHLSLNE